MSTLTPAQLRQRKEAAKKRHKRRQMSARKASVLTASALLAGGIGEHYSLPARDALASRPWVNAVRESARTEPESRRVVAGRAVRQRAGQDLLNVAFVGLRAKKHLTRRR